MYAKVLFIVFIVILLALAGLTVFFYLRGRAPSTPPAATQPATPQYK